MGRSFVLCVCTDPRTDLDSFVQSKLIVVHEHIGVAVDNALQSAPAHKPGPLWKEISCSRGGCAYCFVHIFS